MDEMADSELHALLAGEVRELAGSDLDIIQILNKEHIREQLVNLNYRMKKWVLLMAEGSKTPTQCAIAAGYSKRTVSQQVYRLLKHGVAMRGIASIQREIMLCFGLTLSKKREAILKIAEANQKDKPQISLSAWKLLCEIDGDIGNRTGNTGNIQINIQGLDVKQPIAVNNVENPQN